jgi:type VI secretion system protein ImpL
LYEGSLQKALPRQGNQYVPAPGGGITLTPGFVGWFNRLAALSEALYAGGSQDPRLVYSLRPILSEGVTDMTLRLDGQVLNASTTNTAKQFVWPGTTVREAKASVKFGGTDLGWVNNEGLWAVFQFFEEAERWQPAGPAWLLEWVVRTGRNPFTLPGGRPLTVRFELNMSGAPPLFEKGYLSKLGCVAEIAK